MTLPIPAFREAIVASVAGNSVTVIVAETGAGKSTQVPKFLMDEGYQVVVTQPRRLAARTVAMRVAEEVGCRLGGKVGFRTAYEGEFSKETQLLFCTDGLELVRQLTGSAASGKKRVLVIDEVHEWNLNIETLVAWTRLLLTQGVDLKVVLMSATLDAQALATYYGPNTPVISVPGRLYPVEKSEKSARELVATVRALVAEGRNVLVFQPGKKEIADTISALADLNAEVLPLHGELEPAEQNKVFRHYNRPKVVVATNVAQTSITIDDIDAVVDSGTERRVELVDGIEGLYLKPIAQAHAAQRAGRAGRCKPGVYVLCSDTPLASREAFSKAEIERSRLDQLVLRLAVAGFDATELRFFHQPDSATLADAKRALIALGAMDATGAVTKVGKLMNQMPIDVHLARMVVEADRLGVVDDVLTIAVILEMKGLRFCGKESQNRWRTLTQEDESDFLAELDIWNAAKGKSNPELTALDIKASKYRQAKELRVKLVEELLRRRSQVRFGSTGDRNAILRACCAGMVDDLYRHEYGNVYKKGSDTRERDQDSVVKTGEWVIGQPKDIETQRKRVKHILNFVSKVDPAWLVEVAPQLVRVETGLNAYFAPAKDSVVSTSRTYFNGQQVEEKTVDDPTHPQATGIFRQWLAGQMTI